MVGDEKYHRLTTVRRLMQCLLPTLLSRLSRRKGAQPVTFASLSPASLSVASRNKSPDRRCMRAIEVGQVPAAGGAILGLGPARNACAKPG